MIGVKRLHHLRECAENALKENVTGDFLEAGVWRGGAAILLRGVLAAHGERNRRVWVADSFAGLPPPDVERYPQDAGDMHHAVPYLAVPLEQVKTNFSRYMLLDEQVRFLPGWFRETLPTAPVESLAVLRLDGDMYGSTIEVLNALYDKVSPGGFVIVDDYGAPGTPGCPKAVDDFRRSRGIHEPIEVIDWTGVFWRKDSQLPTQK